VKHAAAFLLFFVPLWWLWIVLAGEWNHTEWIAASGAAAIGAALGEVARTLARARPGVSPKMLVNVPSALGMFFVDFAILLWALAARSAGTFRDADAADAWKAYLATFSPNAYVVDDSSTHHLVPLQKSQEPV
jgi:hypothetical protein